MQPQRNRTATAHFVNLIMTSTVDGRTSLERSVVIIIVKVWAMQEIRRTKHTATRISPWKRTVFIGTCTVLILIKLTKFAVALRLRCGSCKKFFFTLFHHFSLTLKTLYIVWSLVRRRVTLLNIAKYFKTVCCGCGAVPFIFSIYLKPVLPSCFYTAMREI